MGAEALSRGAAFVLGIEQSKQACAVIRQNWQQVAKPEQHFQIIRGDVVQQIKTLAKSQASFDRIYFDPPYASELYQPVIGAIADYSLLDPNGEMAVEHSPNWLPAEFPTLATHRQKVYGSTALTFYRVVS
jgi:16S rRNA (guanine(966)-N(2))-methyltransferase RsmD